MSRHLFSRDKYYRICVDGFPDEAECDDDSTESTDSTESAAEGESKTS
jgi:hypothetical protein